MKEAAWFGELMVPTTTSLDKSRPVTGDEDLKCC